LKNVSFKIFMVAAALERRGHRDFFLQISNSSSIRVTALFEHLSHLPDVLIHLDSILPTLHHPMQTICARAGNHSQAWTDAPPPG
jgi:hypothetical protein